MRTRLAALMFLEYAVQGLWAVPLTSFLMGSPHEGGLNMPAGHVALIYATMAVGATVTPLLLGLLCDRLFAAQRMLAMLHLVGAGLLAAAFWVCTSSQAEIETQFASAATLMEMPDCADLFDRVPSLAAVLEVKQILEESLSPPIGKRWLQDHFSSSTLERFNVRSNPFIDQAQYPEYQRVTQSRLTSLREKVAPAIRSASEHPAVLAAADRAFPPLFFLMLAYACVYVPTTTLANIVAFRNLPDPGRQYGRFRALGTLGWIAAGLFVGFAAPAVSPLPFLYAALASAVLGVLCFFLPHTPPIGTPKTVGDALGLPALRMLAERSFLVYVLTAVVATAVMPFHNIYTNKFLVDLHVDHPAAVQTLAQPTEILGAILIPWVWARFGTKWMLTLGLLAAAGRLLMYATESVPGMMVLGLPLHGVGFAFFYIAAALYVDREAPTDLRASAQGLVTLLTLGLGGIVGNWFAGRVVEYHTVGGVVDWRAVWLVPALGTLLAAVGFAILFKDKVGRG